jgi:hypothetical protein
MNTTFFGRFTDAFKSKNKLYLWNDSEKFFSEKKYEESFSSFFDYLGDDSIDNVTYNVDLNNLVNFSFYQGSKEIKGLIKEGVFSAEAKIATFNKLSVPVMRRLMELNYSLYYSRYAVNEKNIVLKFDSPVADCSPRKLYNALREMALQADKQDDLLIEDFPTLIPVGLQTVVLTDNERNIKLNYFKKWIADTLEKTDSLNSEKFYGAIYYLLIFLI